MAGKLLIVHGGGPTAVINCSLYGTVTEAVRSGRVDGVYAANGGMGGLLREDFIRLDTLPESTLAALLTTPGSAIGTSRDAMEAPEYARAAEVIGKNGFDFLLCNGGNGTMDTCGKIYEACRGAGTPVLVAGIPKTVDNDLAVTDHAPGFASAARYIAGVTREICADVRGLPIHVSVIEAMGRNAGWITAAAALARQDGDIGPDLIYLPERDFDEAAFLRDVERLWARGKGVVAVVSEGLHGPGGKPLVPPIFQTGRSTYFGDISAHLAQLVIRELGIKARSEKPGLMNRSSISWRSPVDCREAEEAGRAAVQAVLSGQTGVMPAIRRLSSEPYETELFLAPIREVMLTERTMPAEYINEAGNGVTEAYCAWLRPLLGEPLPVMANLRGGC
ncbi:MAG: diphosphate--fructose-6-phosphate 1-phosphotransferase [Angelakisella sp.]|jgi:6-phosphofructokinase|nr:diphosphate--fructose-6-phosphate 1-phosphotransferase [Angelakisella sp.]